MRSVILIVSACLSTVFVPSDRDVTVSAPHVTVAALPAGGIQPQTVIDADGTVHAVYFTGKPAGGDVFYVKLKADGAVMSSPVRVNSIDGSALATGSVRGAQVTLGRNGRIHVAWHGSAPVSGSDGSETPVWYATSADGLKFDPQRVVSGNSRGIDGSSVAADRSGHVAVAWHALGRESGENHRTVYLAQSSDDGKTFAAPVPATSVEVGACGCCGLRAQFDRSGLLHILYRAATDGSHRDTTWLMIQATRSRPPVRVDPWDVQTCPMSTYALAETPDGRMAAAWETAQQIYSTTLDPATGKIGAITAVPGSGTRKHPSIAVNAAGARLIAWTEGTGWNRGGTFAWRLTDQRGVELAADGQAGPVPVWGLVSAVSLSDGSFLILR